MCKQQSGTGFIMDIQLTNDGFLAEFHTWSEQVARWLAEQENITLSEEHWVILHAAREFYITYELIPSIRALIKLIQTKKPNVTSITINKAFPSNAIRYICKLAGLPKPKHCT